MWRLRLYSTPLASLRELPDAYSASSSSKLWARSRCPTASMRSKITASSSGVQMASTSASVGSPPRQYAASFSISVSRRSAWPGSLPQRSSMCLATCALMCSLCVLACLVTHPAISYFLGRSHWRTPPSFLTALCRASVAGIDSASSATHVSGMGSCRYAAIC